MNGYHGPERRSPDYIAGKVDGLQRQVSDLKSLVDKHMDTEEQHVTRIYDKLEDMRKESNEKLEAIEDRVISNEKQLDIYKHVWWALKALAIAIAGAVFANFEAVLRFFIGK